MKPILKNHRNALASILFIFAVSVQLNAQDTIHCPDNRYYWNDIPCDYGRSITAYKDAYHSTLFLLNPGSVISTDTTPVYGYGVSQVAGYCEMISSLL